jgi:hypothetical protein
MAYKSLGMSIKILSQHSVLDKSNAIAGPPPEQDIPLQIPKKTKLYVEQTQRERDNGVDIHRIFQRDLCKLRLTTARAYVKVLTDGQGPISYAGGSSVRLTATVHGLGPHFKVKLNVQNTGSKNISHVPVSVTYNRAIHFISKPLFHVSPIHNLTIITLPHIGKQHSFDTLESHWLQIPLLVPGPQAVFEIDVECIDAQGGSVRPSMITMNTRCCVKDHVSFFADTDLTPTTTTGRYSYIRMQQRFLRPHHIGNHSNAIQWASALS